MQKLFYLSFFIFSSIYTIIAQENTIKISGKYSNKKPLEIIEDIRTKFGIDIYYKQEELPFFERTMVFEDTYVEKAISDLLGKSDLIPIWYRNYAIVLMNKAALDRSKLVSYYDNIQKILDEKPNVKSNVIVIGSLSDLGTIGKAIVSGTIKDQTSGETIIGANVKFGKGLGTVTDIDGQFTYSLTPGIHNIEVKYIGYQDYNATIDIRSDGSLHIDMMKESINLDEITVTAIAKDASVNEVQTGIARIDIKNLDRVPTFLGEKDIVKAILLNPGVSTIGEGATGFNVRGGNVDQNLVIQDEAILFNSSHALGFFSTFNADLIKDATLSKGSMAANNGGRIASSLEVNLKEGNREKMKYKASFNPISATVSIDGPLSKRSTLVFGARSTYSDYIFGLFSDPKIKYSSASFYDVNLKYTYRKNGHTLGIGVYTSNDDFVFNRQFGFGYKTKFVQLNWGKLFNDKMSNKFSLVASRYTSQQLDLKPQFESQLNSGIDYLRLVDKISIVGKSSKIDFGINATLYKTSPGDLSPYKENSFALAKGLDNEKGIESAAYVSLEKSLTQKLDILVGFRINHFAALGPKEVYLYKDNVFKEINIIGKETKSGVLKSYLIPEPRLSVKLNLAKSASFKAGYAKTSQFINQIFNSDTPTPSSQWQLSNGYIKPYLSDNYSIGFFKNFANDNYETSVEVYDRRIGRLYDYKDFAKLIVNDHIETELLQGIGKSRGIELSFKKNDGKVNGWLSYTYSRTLQKIEGINNGNWYSSGYDKPHNLSLILNYQPILRKTITLNFTYSTGRPSTAPLSNYLTPDNVYVPIYTQRNEIRIPSYHRLDLSYNIARSHNNAAKVITSWTFTLYNVYARKNPFSVFYTRGVNSTPQANRLAVIGTVFPAIRFNIEFL